MILNKWNGEYPEIDVRWLAYMLATVYRETENMQPIDEIGKGDGKKYGEKNKRIYNKQKKIWEYESYELPDKIYFGRGLVQLTWFDNYERFGKLLGYDNAFLNDPELVKRFDLSLEILFKGMIKGWFTGVSLEKYFNELDEDWINARRIINEIDHAEEIKVNAIAFHNAILEAQKEDEEIKL